MGRKISQLTEIFNLGSSDEILIRRGDFNYRAKVSSLLSSVALNDGNTVAWYDFTDIATITKGGDNKVSVWASKIGDNHLTQATEERKPLYVTGAGIRFDGVDDCMKTLAFTLNQPESIYMVVKQITWGSDKYLFDGNAVASGIIYQYQGSPKLRALAGSGFGESTELSVGAYGIIRVQFNGDNSKFTINSAATAIGNAGAANMGGFTLGSNAEQGDSFSNIEVKEVIIRKAADTAEVSNSIYLYLKNKYAL